MIQRLCEKQIRNMLDNHLGIPYENIKIKGDKAYIQGKSELEIILPLNRHVGDNNLLRFQDGYYGDFGEYPIPLSIFRGKYSSLHTEAYFLVGNYYYHEGHPAFEINDSGKDILLKVNESNYISRDTLKENGIKFIKSDRQKRETLAVAKINDEKFKERYKEVIAQYYNSLDEKYKNNEFLYKMGEQKLPVYTKIASDFHEKINALMEKYGIEERCEEVKVKRYNEPENFYIFQGVSVEATGQNIKFCMDLNDKNKINIRTPFQNCRFEDLQTKEEVENEIKNILKQEEEYIQNAIELKKEVLEPLLEEAKDTGIEVFQLKGLKVCYRENYAWNWFGDDADDVHDEGWVETSYLKEEFINNSNCAEIKKKMCKELDRIDYDRDEIFNR